MDVADLLPLVIQVGALAGAVWTIMRSISAVRSSVRESAEAEVHGARDARENRQAVEALSGQLDVMRESLVAHHAESAEGRRQVYERLTAIEKSMAVMDGDVRVLTARINAHGINGHSKSSTGRAA